MKSKRNLMTVLVGLAMLATPITAAAKDHNHRADNNPRPAQVRVFNAPARHFAAARVAPARVAPMVVTSHPFRNRAVFAPAPMVRADRHEWKYGPDGDGDADDYMRAGRGGYYAAPGPVVAPYYAAPASMGYAGARSCARARHFRIVYQQDRATGHPAAAADVLRNHEWAFRGGCGSVAPMGGGLLNSFGGLGNGYVAAPAYNYGGYGQPYAGGYNGYNGYNGGYGQPYGGGSALLAPLLQQFVH